MTCLSTVSALTANVIEYLPCPRLQLDNFIQITSRYKRNANCSVMTTEGVRSTHSLIK